MSRPFPPRSFPPSQLHRINGKIRTSEVRIIAQDGQQLGIVSLNDALGMARQQGVDLVEISPNAVPPVCRLVDYGKFKYEISKKDKESKKNQHVGRVKEIQLSVKIEAHDFDVKLEHAVDFLCDEMKVKIALRFRGREMVHPEFGFQVINRFIQACAPYATPDQLPKLVGKGINLTLNPLPRGKRAKKPEASDEEMEREQAQPQGPSEANPKRARPVINTDAAQRPSDFGSTPFDKLSLPEGQ